MAIADRGIEHHREIVEAESRGEARGRAAVLAEVAKLPSPVFMSKRLDEGFGQNWKLTGYRWRCAWCDWTTDVMLADGPTMPPTHGENCCIWARAHAAGVAAPEAQR
jgi:hypothetical protein